VPILSFKKSEIRVRVKASQPPDLRDRNYCTGKRFHCKLHLLVILERHVHQSFLIVLSFVILHYLFILLLAKFEECFICS